MCVGVLRVSAITHTPASGPFAPVTTPPMSSLSMATFPPAWPMIRWPDTARNTATLHARSTATDRFFVLMSPSLLRRTWSLKGRGSYTPEGRNGRRGEYHLPDRRADLEVGPLLAGGSNAHDYPDSRVHRCAVGTCDSTGVCRVCQRPGRVQDRL